MNPTRFVTEMVEGFLETFRRDAGDTRSTTLEALLEQAEEPAPSRRPTLPPARSWTESCQRSAALFARLARGLYAQGQYAEAIVAQRQAQAIAWEARASYALEVHVARTPLTEPAARRAYDHLVREMRAS